MREAQRLAVAISRIDTLAEYKRREILLAAAELRRLDAREAELLALLRQANERLMDNRDDVERIESARYMRVCYDPVIVAIKAATGETK